GLVVVPAAGVAERRDRPPRLEAISVLLVVPVALQPKLLTALRLGKGRIADRAGHDDSRTEHQATQDGTTATDRSEAHFRHVNSPVDERICRILASRRCVTLSQIKTATSPHGC